MELPPLSAQPLVSVLMANYNYAAHVGKAIRSVLEQTYPNLELLVCDDASTDNSAQVIQAYADRDPRITFVRKLNNGGQASGFNALFPLAQGEILCLLDADDAFEPEKVQRVVKQFQQHADCGLIVHRMLMVTGSGTPIQRIPFLTPFEEGWLANTLLRRGGRWRYMPTSALAIRRAAAELVFPMPEPLFRISADAFIFTLLPLLTKVRAVDEVLTRYTVHGENGVGGLLRDEKTFRRLLESESHAIEGVNRRLTELGRLQYRLDESRNLNCMQSRFGLALFTDQTRRQLARAYLPLAAALLRDDMYNLPQRLLGILVYGVALLLPRPWRSTWLTRALVPNRFKSRIQGLFECLRRRGQ